MSKPYLVTIEIDAYAPTPEDAVKIAWKALTDRYNDAEGFVAVVDADTAPRFYNANHAAVTELDPPD